MNIVKAKLLATEVIKRLGLSQEVFEQSWDDLAQLCLSKKKKLRFQLQGNESGTSFDGNEQIADEAAVVCLVMKLLKDGSPKKFEDHKWAEKLVRKTFGKIRDLEKRGLLVEVSEQLQKLLREDLELSEDTIDPLRFDFKSPFPEISTGKIGEIKKFIDSMLIEGYPKQFSLTIDWYNREVTLWHLENVLDRIEQGHDFVRDIYKNTNNCRRTIKLEGDADDLFFLYSLLRAAKSKHATLKKREIMAAYYDFFSGDDPLKFKNKNYKNSSYFEKYKRRLLRRFGSFWQLHENDFIKLSENYINFNASGIEIADSINIQTVG